MGECLWEVLTGNTWKEHGQLVEDLKKYFPTLFHRAPATLQQASTLATRPQSITSISSDWALDFSDHFFLTSTGSTSADSPHLSNCLFNGQSRPGKFLKASS